MKGFPGHRRRGTFALATDAGLRVRAAADGVFALGDCAAVAGVGAPSSAQMTMQQAAVAAANARAFLAGRESVVPFNFVDLGEARALVRRRRVVPRTAAPQVVSLGENNAAAAALPGLSDALTLDGPAAALGRRLLYAARMPTRGARVAALSGLAASKQGSPPR